MNVYDFVTKKQYITLNRTCLKYDKNLKVLYFYNFSEIFTIHKKKKIKIKYVNVRIPSYILVANKRVHIIQTANNRDICCRIHCQV